MDRLAFTSTPKLRQGYLTVVVSQANRKEYGGFAQAILKLRLEDDKGQTLWVEQIERNGSSFQVRFEMKDLSESGMEQDALIGIFRAEIGRIAERKLLVIKDLRDGAL